MKHRRKSYFKRWAIVSAVVCVVAVFTALTVSQRIRLKSLRAEQAELTKQLKELQMEEQRLKLYASYVKSPQFASDYARNELGYISPDEIILADK